MCKPNAIRLAAPSATPASATPSTTGARRRGEDSRLASTTGMRTAAEALIAAAVTNAEPAPMPAGDSGGGHRRASPAAGSRSVRVRSRR